MMPIVDADRLPAQIEPDGPATDCATLVQWCRGNQPEVRRLLHRHGALLFRGFGVRSPADFADVARAACATDLVGYANGAARRKMVIDGVYTSTEYPPQVRIPSHNELSHTKEWIPFILFWCEVAPEERGETPLVDGRDVIRRLSPATAALFREKQITYDRYFHSGDGSGILENNVRVLDESGYPSRVSWQYTFVTTDRSAIQAQASRVGAKIEWTEEGGLSWRETLPAIRRHPATGEESWFNQLLTFHPWRMPGAVRSRLPAREYPRNARFGDGSLIADDVIEEIRACTAASEALFPWQAGDVLMIDNVLVAHGRRTFEGRRRVLTAMAGRPS